MFATRGERVHLQVNSSMLVWHRPTGADPCGAARSGHDGSSLELFGLGSARVGWIRMQHASRLTLVLVGPCVHVLRAALRVMRWHIVHCAGAGRRAIRAASRGKRPSHIATATGGYCSAPVINMELVVVHVEQRTRGQVEVNCSNGSAKYEENKESERAPAHISTDRQAAGRQLTGLQGQTGSWQLADGRQLTGLQGNNFKIKSRRGARRLRVASLEHLEVHHHLDDGRAGRSGCCCGGLC